MRRRRINRSTKTGWAILPGLILMPGILFAAQLSFKPGWNLFSPKQDVEVGRENAAQVAKELPILHDAEVESYVNDLGRRLSSYAPNNKPEYEYAWQFKVVNSADINAFALPGGFIYVNRATIESAQDEAQLAGVIAHEEGHVVMRHGTHQATEMMAAQLPLSILGGLLGQSGSVMSQLAEIGIGLGVNSVFLHNSRSMETQADEVGTYVLYQAGYDTHAMAQFFEIIQKKYPNQTLQFFSDHPNPGNRIKNVDDEIPKLGPPRPGKTDSPEFRAAKKRVMSLPPPPKPHSAAPQDGSGGGSAADVMPSGHMRTYRHATYQIDYPDNWQVFGDENSAVTIAPRAGITDHAVAYGVMIGSFQPEPGHDASLDQAMHQLLDSLRQGNPDLRVIGHDEEIRVDGMAGKSVELVGPTPVRRQDGSSQRERDWLVAIERNDYSLLYLIFISPEDDSRRLRVAFENMLKSFSFPRV